MIGLYKKRTEVNLDSIELSFRAYDRKERDTVMQYNARRLAETLDGMVIPAISPAIRKMTVAILDYYP
jgi:hypothetical protein